METHKCNSLTYLTIIRTTFYKCFQPVWDWRNIFFSGQRNNDENSVSSLEHVEGCLLLHRAVPAAPQLSANMPKAERGGAGCQGAAMGTASYPLERRVSFETLLQRRGGCWEPAPYKLLLQSFALVRYWEFLGPGHHRGQSAGVPKSVVVVSKGSAKMLQVSIWNDLPVGETSS